MTDRFIAQNTGTPEHPCWLIVDSVTDDFLFGDGLPRDEREAKMAARAANRAAAVMLDVVCDELILVSDTIRKKHGP